MYGHEILNWFHEHPAFFDHFLGVFTWSSVPQLKDANYFILNTVSNPEKTGHWLVCGQRNSVVEYFDSLGCPKRARQFVADAKVKWPSHFDHNVTQYQPTNSVKCGQFAIYFLFHRLLNIDLSYEQVLKRIFSANTRANEKLVANFFAYHGNKSERKLQ